MGEGAFDTARRHHWCDMTEEPDEESSGDDWCLIERDSKRVLRDDQPGCPHEQHMS